MTNYNKGSMGANDAKNQKWTAGIYLLGFILLHLAAIFIPEHSHFSGWRLILFGVAAVALAALCIAFLNNADLTEDFGWPQVVVIVLSFASAVSIGWVGDKF